MFTETSYTVSDKNGPLVYDRNGNLRRVVYATQTVRTYDDGSVSVSASLLAKTVYSNGRETTNAAPLSGPLVTAPESHAVSA